MTPVDGSQWSPDDTRNTKELWSFEGWVEKRMEEVSWDLYYVMQQIIQQLGEL